MDQILKVADKYVFTPHIYSENWSESSLSRQFLSLMTLVTLGGYVLYFVAAGLSYIFVFDKRLMKHPLFLKVNRFKIDYI